SRRPPESRIAPRSRKDRCARWTNPIEERASRATRPYSKQEQRCGMKAFDYLEPASAEEACRMLADAGPGARPLAGGTDLLIQMEMGKVTPATLVYLGRAEDLARIDGDAGRGLRIGGAATLRAIEMHPV